MSKGARVHLERHSSLERELASLRGEMHRASIVMACLVKRFGEVYPRGVKMQYQQQGWEILVTDEEIVALDSHLEAHRSESKLGIVLRVLQKEQEPAGIDVVTFVKELETAHDAMKPEEVDE